MLPADVTNGIMLDRPQMLEVTQVWAKPRHAWQRNMAADSVSVYIVLDAFMIDPLMIDDEIHFFSIYDLCIFVI